MDHFSDLPGEHCLNCGTPMPEGFHYCRECGQQRIASNESYGAIFKSFLGDYFTFDSKIAGSIKPLLFKPGYLTVEYNRGRRARYIAPLRMYIFISLVFFLVFSTEKAPEANAAESVTDLQVWNAFFSNYLPRLFFVMLPLFAALVGLLFRKSGSGYISNLVLSLHYHSYIFLVLTLYLIVSRITASFGWYSFNSILISALAVWFLIYLYFSLRLTFKLKHWATVLRYFMLLLLYATLIMSVLLTIVGYITFAA